MHLNHHHCQYSPYPGVPSKRKMAKVHHGPIAGGTWTLSRLHTEVVSGLVVLPVNFLPLSYLAICLQTQPPNICGTQHKIQCSIVEFTVVMHTFRAVLR